MIIDVNLVGAALGVVVTLAAIFNWCVLVPMRKVDALRHALETLESTIIRFEGTVDSIVKAQADIDKRLIVVEHEQKTMWRRIDELKKIVLGESQ